ncbi:craniofacial development protein 2-like [Centruroides sculpturatus]|uniref:craniofacial development protein 2-like n=1 Tax=Centruroides sculpturatus TaxID=218467 RepID=UPI000C6D104F|nr:craniofacial development protein 2-like [Centruroides sculpturatus]
MPGRGSYGASQVVTMQNPHRKTSIGRIRIGTWNVRTMLRPGKLETVKREMKRQNLDILGLSEVRWEDSGDFFSDEFRVIYSCGTKGKNGVAFILGEKVKNSVERIECKGDRILMIKIKSDPMDMMIFQVYMPTGDYDDEEVEEIYDQIEDVIENDKTKKCLIVMGDWNASVGEGGDGKFVGKFGLGNRNERGERLVEFATKHQLIVGNTWFKQSKRRLYTWKMPGDIGRYQIDYILIQSRFRNAVKKIQTYPGADADSDHNLLTADIVMKLKKSFESQKNKKMEFGKAKWKYWIKF